MLPLLCAMSAMREGVVTAEQALAAGLTREEIRRLVREKSWTRIRRGAYVGTDCWATADPNTRHRLLVRATLLLGDRSAVVCDRSAVAWHGLDTLAAPPAAVHVRMATGSGGRSSGLLVRHLGDVAPHLRLRHGEVLVVTPALAAVEMACSVGFHEAVVVCDSALRSGATPQELVSALAVVAGRHGSPGARRAVGFADARSGSAGESLSRVVLHEVGLDPEDLQTPIRDDKGLVGVTDFSWLAHQTVGEFDGRVKYGRDGPNAESRDVLWRERQREDRLRALGPGDRPVDLGRTPATRGDRPADPCGLAAGGAADARRLSAVLTSAWTPARGRRDASGDPASDPCRLEPVRSKPR